MSKQKVPTSRHCLRIGCLACQLLNGRPKIFYSPRRQLYFTYVDFHTVELYNIEISNVVNVI